MAGGYNLCKSPLIFYCVAGYLAAKRSYTKRPHTPKIWGCKTKINRNNVRIGNGTVEKLCGLPFDYSIRRYINVYLISFTFPNSSDI